MTNSCDVAIVGATGLVGESLIALLEEREFPLGQLYLLAGPDSAGTRVEFRGGYVQVRELAGFDFSQVKLAIFATGSQVAAEFARQRKLYQDLGARTITSIEAMKTIAFEVAEQLAVAQGPKTARTGTATAWRAPDWAKRRLAPRGSRWSCSTASPTWCSSRWTPPGGTSRSTAPWSSGWA